MSLVKKILFLIILFVGFVIYSVYDFNYDSQLNNQNLVSNVNEIKDSDTGLIDKIINMFSSLDDKEKKPFSLVLTKKDGMVVMDGIFANEKDTKKVSEILNINRDGEYTYEENIVIDEVLLSKIATIITPFKDFFEDGAKLSIINDEVFLSGELKDPNQYSLLDSILSRIDVSLVKDISIANPTLINSENDQERTTDTAATVNQTNNQVNVNKAKVTLTPDEIQLHINEILADKKIAFERRSSTVTEDSKISIVKIADILKEYKNIKLEIAGHTDSRGDNALNKKISQDRANSVKDVLVSLGINADRLKAVGYGEDFPIAKDDENGLSEINRRVDFNILGE
ncbi:MAG: OmpA family protein [Aliarcobacter sp.]|nr:OmpA family protein [Aliarcobacter sp.]